MNAAVDPYILQQASCRASLLVATAGLDRTNGKTCARN